MQIAATRKWFEIFPAEKLVLNISLVLVVLNLGQVILRDVNFDWNAYLSVAAIAFGCFSLGQFYRISGRSPRIGLALVCTGLFTLFSSMVVVFNYLLMPVASQPIDATLVWLDSLMGYHWPSVIAWGAEHPTINTILKYAYMTTMPQVGAMIIILGMSGRARQLHAVVVSMTITSVIAIVFWGYFPSHGAKSLFELAPEIEALANPFVTTGYGKELLRMAAEGPGLITPSEIKGLIAFPSYHIVLACTALYAVRNVKWVFPVYLVLNILILPATSFHGGHHMVDAFAGIALFVVGTILAEKTVGKMYKESGQPEQLEPDMKPADAAAPQEI